MQYRPEIDGLRAIAVLLVIGFHAELGVFSSGYLGVDIFFVISGYLITTLLLEQFSAERFSFLNFYKRRIKRLFPALFFMLIIVSPFAWLILDPSDFRLFGKSIVGATTFTSNIIFWKETGYFGTAVEWVPLLHTWSLAVEEQFYLLFPIFLLLIWRFTKNWLTVLFIIALLLSLALAEWAWRYSPQANFFLLPTRAWELLCGGLAAIYAFKHAPRPSPTLSLVGLLMLCASLVFFSNDTPFPSLLGLLPVVGTALLLLFTDRQQILGKVLAQRTLVSIGLVSYSAYLWHQPLFVLTRYYLDQPLSSALTMMLILITLVLAYVSWYFVERPCRRAHMQGKQVLIVASASSLLLFSLGLGFSLKSNYQRFDSDQIALFKAGEYAKNELQNGLLNSDGCFLSKEDIATADKASDCISTSRENQSAARQRLIFIGDSHAAHFVEPARTLWQSAQLTVHQWSSASCRPLLYPGVNQRCERYISTLTNDILPELTDRDTVIISSNWWRTNLRIGIYSLFDGLSETLQKLKSSNARIILLGNSPVFTRPPYAQTARRKNTEQSVVLTTLPYTEINQQLALLAEQLNVEFYDPTDTLCLAEQQCWFRWEQNYWYYDQNHLTQFGAKPLLNALQQALNIIHVNGEVNHSSIN